MTTSIQDHIEIEQLLARYTHAADIHPPAAMRDIFAADGRFHIDAMGVDAKGIEAIVEFFTGMRGDMAGVFHVTSNLVIDIDGNTATAVSYLTIMQTGAETKINGFARYEDELVRTDQGWRIQSRGIDL